MGTKPEDLKIIEWKSFNVPNERLDDFKAKYLKMAAIAIAKEWLKNCHSTKDSASNREPEFYSTRVQAAINSGDPKELEKICEEVIRNNPALLKGNTKYEETVELMKKSETDEKIKKALWFISQHGGSEDHVLAIDFQCDVKVEAFVKDTELYSAQANDKLPEAAKGAFFARAQASHLSHKVIDELETKLAIKTTLIEEKRKHLEFHQKLLSDINKYSKMTSDEIINLPENEKRKALKLNKVSVTEKEKYENVIKDNQKQIAGLEANVLVIQEKLSRDIHAIAAERGINAHARETKYTDLLKSWEDVTKKLEEAKKLEAILLQRLIKEKNTDKKAGIERKLKILNESMAILTKKAASVKKSPSWQQPIQGIESLEKKIKDKDSHIKELSDERAARTREKETLVEQITGIKKNINRIKGTIQELTKKQIAILFSKKETKPPTGENTDNASHVSAISRIQNFWRKRKVQKQQKELIKKIEELSKDLEKLENELIVTNTDIDVLSLEIHDTTFDKTLLENTLKITQLNMELDLLQDKHSSEPRDAYIIKIASLKTEIKQLEEKIIQEEKVREARDFEEFEIEKEDSKFIVAETVVALVSTARPVADTWSSHVAIETPGGAEQIFVGYWGQNEKIRTEHEMHYSVVYKRLEELCTNSSGISKEEAQKQAQAYINGTISESSEIKVTSCLYRQAQALFQKVDLIKSVPVDADWANSKIQVCFEEIKDLKEKLQSPSFNSITDNKDFTYLLLSLDVAYEFIHNIKTLREGLRLLNEEAKAIEEYSPEAPAVSTEAPKILPPVNNPRNTPAARDAAAQARQALLDATGKPGATTPADSDSRSGVIDLFEPPTTPSHQTKK